MVVTEVTAQVGDLTSKGLGGDCRREITHGALPWLDPATLMSRWSIVC